MPIGQWGIIARGVGVLNQCCEVWLPICGAWILLNRGMARLTSSSCSFFFVLTIPKSENLALAVHVSLSISASLQVIACFGSFWWDTQVFFKYVIHFSWTWEVHLVCYGRLTIENKCQDKLNIKYQNKWIYLIKF